MRALDLDLVRRRPQWPRWVLLAVGLALAGEGLVAYLRLDDELAALQERRLRPPASRATDPLPEQTQREFDAARRLLRELALPWDGLFRAIEAAIDKETALLAIEPDAAKSVVRIIGEARDYPSILAFMVRLEEGPTLARIHLLNHEIREDVAERPYLFSLAATWKAAP